MTSSAVNLSIAMGCIHGFVVWRLLFRLVGPVARLSQGRSALRLRVTSGVAYIMVLGFLLALAFLLLEVFGRTVTSSPTKESRGYVFIGSMAGLFLSGLLPKVEAALGRSPPKNRGGR